MSGRVLLVEDDANLASSIEAFLGREGYVVDVSASVKEARARLENRPSVLILDWMLPDGQGIDFLKELRLSDHALPVIVLTARAELIDRVLGLEAGANDYMVKPFEPRELLARIRVQLRTAASGKAVAGNPAGASGAPAQAVVAGLLQMDPARRQALYRGASVELSKMEFDLLKAFAESPGRVFSREELLNRVWGYDAFPTTRTVDVHVLQLRQKIEDRVFETVRGVGYRFCPEKAQF